MRARRSFLFALTVALVITAARPADAAEYCYGSAQPEGDPQYGSCKALLPFNFLGAFAGSLMKASQLPIPSAAQAIVSEIGADAQDSIFGEWFSTHTLFWAETVFPLCSFKH